MLEWFIIWTTPVFMIDNSLFYSNYPTFSKFTAHTGLKKKKAIPYRSAVSLFILSGQYVFSDNSKWPIHGLFPYWRTTGCFIHIWVLFLYNFWEVSKFLDFFFYILDTCSILTVHRLTVWCLGLKDIRLVSMEPFKSTILWRLSH